MANLVEIQHLKHLYNIKRDYCDYFDILLHFGPNTYLNATWLKENPIKF